MRCRPTDPPVHFRLDSPGTHGCPQAGEQIVAKSWPRLLIVRVSRDAIATASRAGRVLLYLGERLGWTAAASVAASWSRCLSSPGSAWPPGRSTIGPGTTSDATEAARAKMYEVAGRRSHGTRAAEQCARKRSSSWCGPRSSTSRPKRPMPRACSYGRKRATSKRPARAASSNSTDSDYVLTNRHVIRAADMQAHQDPLGRRPPDQSDAKSGTIRKPTSP